MARTQLRTRAILLVGVGLSPACSDILEVENPGLIEDESLNRPESVPGLVGGMSGDYSFALGQLVFGAALFAHEQTYAGAYDYHAIPYSGIIQADVSEQFYWSNMHRARWVSETGVERLETILGEEYASSVWAARANLLAGFSNRLLGENMCDAVFDGGAALLHTAHFERAEGYFAEAVRVAGAGGHTELRLAGLAGRATVRAWLGDWDGAVADAAQVPLSFSYHATYSTNTARETNQLVQETVVRFEASTWGTQWTDLQDPRAPFEILLDPGGEPRLGRDGFTPVHRQEKYPDPASDIPIAKGTEMVLLRAEASLREGDVAAAMERINEVRDFYFLESLSAATAGDVWQILQTERGAVLWLEGRTFWDYRRWYEEGRHSFMDGRDRCIPIGEIELRNNPNL